jgi:hypothetical protein
VGKEEMAMKVGDIVRIKKCNSLPDVVGEGAEIASMQIQEFEKYTVYPVWVRMTTGERRGKIYGFQYDEVEVPPGAYGRQIMKTEVAKQWEELLKGVTTLEDIAEIERAINEVKGNILAEPASGFWEGKTPCWEMLHCPEPIKNECSAFKHQTLPCWQIEGTYCKVLNQGIEGTGTDICRVCRVYRRWESGEPLEIKLSGRGANLNLPKVLKHLALP